MLQRDKVAYMLLNQGKDFQMNDSTVEALHTALDEVEATSACMLITLSSSPLIFSTGFQLPYLMEHETNAFRVNTAFQGLLKRIITFPMPTVCLIRGHCYAAGLMMAMSHDVRIM